MTKKRNRQISKWILVALPYFAVWAGLFIFKNAVITLLAFHTALVLALIILRPLQPIHIFFKPVYWPHVVLSMALCAASGIFIYSFREMLQITNDLPLQLSHLALQGNTWPAFIAYFTLVNPFLEEYFWREALGSNAKGLYLGDLFYASYHVLVLWGRVPLLSMVFTVITLIFAGWFWRQLYARDGSLLAPVLGHMAADLSILLAVYFMVH